MNPAEMLACEALSEHGMRAERFAKHEIGRTRTPDFRVFRADELVSFCEAKHIQHDAWLDNKMRNARPLEIVGGGRPDPIFNRLATHIHEAAQQFEAVNSAHTCPNILAFANSDHLCEFLDLIRVLTGNEYTDTGEVDPIFTQYSEGQIKMEKYRIDLYLWKDIRIGGDPRVRYFYVESSLHYKRLCELFGSDPRNHRHIP